MNTSSNHIKWISQHLFGIVSLLAQFSSQFKTSGENLWVLFIEAVFLCCCVIHRKQKFVSLACNKYKKKTQSIVIFIDISRLTFKITISYSKTGDSCHSAWKQIGKTFVDCTGRQNYLKCNIKRTFHHNLKHPFFFFFFWSVQSFSHDSAVSHFKSVALKSQRKLLHRNTDNTALCGNAQCLWSIGNINALAMLVILHRHYESVRNIGRWKVWMSSSLADMSERKTIAPIDILCRL